MTRNLSDLDYLKGRSIFRLSPSSSSVPIHKKRLDRAMIKTHCLRTPLMEMIVTDV